MTDLSRYPHLATIESPADLRKISDDELPGTMHPCEGMIGQQFGIANQNRPAAASSVRFSTRCRWTCCSSTVTKPRPIARVTIGHWLFRERFVGEHSYRRGRFV